MRILTILMLLLGGCSSAPGFEDAAPVPADASPVDHDAAPAVSVIQGAHWAPVPRISADAGIPDAAPPRDAAEPDTGSAASSPDAGPADAGTDAAMADSGRDAMPPDASRDAGPPDSGSDAGADSGPPDAGTDAGPADSGPPDSGMDAQPDAGVDSGPPDSGEGSCTPDGFEPNETEGDAVSLGFVTEDTWAVTIDPTFHDDGSADADWYRADFERSTGQPARVIAEAIPRDHGWVRLTYYCAGATSTDPDATCWSGRCEEVALDRADLTVSCSNDDARAHATVEVTPAVLTVCGYRFDLEIRPG